MVADCNSTLAKWRNHFAQFFNVYWDSKFKQTEILHTAELLVPESSAFEFEMGIGKLKERKSPGTD